MILSTDLIKYCELLTDLHLMIDKDEGDSEFADKIRDQMDIPWYKLSEEEIVISDILSCDLYSHAPKEEWPKYDQDFNGTHDFLLNLNKFTTTKDVIEYLNILKQKQFFFSREFIAFNRALLWESLTVSKAAIYFIDDAIKNASTLEYIDIFKSYLMKFSITYDVTKSISILDDIINRKNEINLNVLVNASLVQQYMVVNFQDNVVLKEAIDLIQFIINKNNVNDQSVLSDKIVSNLYTMLSIYMNKADKFNSAKQCLDNAIEKNDNNKIAIFQRGVSEYGSSNEEAIKYFLASIEKGLISSWPHFYLAHYYLLNKKYYHVISECNEALKINPNPLIQPYLFEWLAISSFNIKKDISIVKELFDLALNCGSAEHEIVTNYKIFQEIFEHHKTESSDFQCSKLINSRIRDEVLTNSFNYIFSSPINNTENIQSLSR